MLGDRPGMNDTRAFSHLPIHQKKHGRENGWFVEDFGAKCETERGIRLTNHSMLQSTLFEKDWARFLILISCGVVAVLRDIHSDDDICNE